MSCSSCQRYVDIEDLSLPYVIRSCPSCGRRISLRVPGNNGHGFKVEKGDQIILPDNWLQISANPLKGIGTFTKSGLEWFAKSIFLEDIPKQKDNIELELAKNEEYCLRILRDSELLNSKNLSVENESQQDEVWELLYANQQTSEWWAYIFALYNSVVQDAISDNDAKRAGWAMACAERCRSMLVFKQEFEEAVWMGHSARRIVNVLELWDSNKTNSQEAFWQQVFMDNPFVLSQVFSVPVVFIEEGAYVGGMGIDRRDAKLVDYLYKNESSNDALLIEIKTPKTRLVTSPYRKSVHAPHAELSGAVVQVLDYRRSLSSNYRSITEGTSHQIDVFSPRCIVLAGDAEVQLDTPEKRKSFELFRTNLKDVEIVTYDELFKKAETLAKLFNLVRRPR